MGGKDVSYYKPPQVDKLLNHQGLRDLLDKHGRDVLIYLIRWTISEVRKEGSSPAEEELIGLIRKNAGLFSLSSYTRVINAAGVILHTNLGRAPYPVKVTEEIVNNLSRYSLLEVDPYTGKRRKREFHIEKLLQIWTGAEAALVVNNNAAAVFITLNTLSNHREVLVSRSRLVEIGGSFRLPDIIKSSGAILRDVGTTNRTYVKDFEKNITEDTGLLLYVHQSNYVIKGFAKDVGIKEMKELSARYKIPLVLDIGSGAPFHPGNDIKFNDPTIHESVRFGANVVCFSADKLFGGCQGGIILGDKETISKIRSNPLFRIVRPDKFTYLFLEKMVGLYLNGNPAEDIPIYRMISASEAELEKKAEKLAKDISKIPGVDTRIKKDTTELGGGASPEAVLPTYLVCISSGKYSEDEIASYLRRNSVPIFTRTFNELVAFDVRTMFDDDTNIVISALTNLFRQ